MAWHEVLDIKSARQVFVVGDIHGAYDKLWEALNKVGFDPKANDVLLSVGDLVDRGPKNLEVIEMLYQDWFYAVRGNHEQLAIDAFRDGDYYLHSINGGDWFRDLTLAQQQSVVALFQDLPTYLTVKLPDGRKIGLVHAETHTEADSWKQAIEGPSAAQRTTFGRYRPEPSIWGRGLVGVERNIKHIDHVYLGHTPMDEPITKGNQTWLDTGGTFAKGYFTLIKVYG